MHPALVRTIMNRLPETRFWSLKRALLRSQGAAVGPGVKICSSAKFMGGAKLFVGAQTWIGQEFLLVGGRSEVFIGNNCDIGPRVMIATGSHEIVAGGARVAGAGYSLPISVGDGSWIGAGAILLGGASVGSGSIVAAGAVVRDEFPDGVLIAGIPAAIRKTL